MTRPTQRVEFDVCSGPTLTRAERMALASRPPARREEAAEQAPPAVAEPAPPAE